MSLKTLMENWRKFNKVNKILNEEASPAQFPKDEFPTRLSQVKPDVAKKQTTGGQKDGNPKDDVINVS